MHRFCSSASGITRPSTRILPLTLAAAIGAALSPASAWAQSDDSVQQLEEIIVTARGREENLQDVPIAISAFDAEAIERRGIAELEDVARFTAGFAFEDAEGGAANPSIRSQSTLRGTAREQTVATFVDGVYMPRNWLVDIGTSNLERIEIVKGPQSARFGRNAFAGAINYITQKAGNEAEAQITATIGNVDTREIGVSGTWPIIDGVLSVRGTYDHVESDGTWGNNHPNANLGLSPGTDGNVGGRDTDTLSFNLMYTPTDDLTIDVSYYHADREEEARAVQYLNTRQNLGTCGALQPVDGGGLGFSLFCGTFGVVADDVTVDPRGFGRQGKSDIVSASVSYDMSDAWNVSYTFGWVDAENRAAATAEADTVYCGTILGPPVFPSLCNFQGSPLGFVDYNQHELRFTFDGDGKSRGAFGVFLMDGLDSRFAVSANVAPGGSSALRLTRFTRPNFENFVFVDEESQTDVWAVFGEFAYEFSDVMRLNVEARYTSEKIESLNLRANPAALIGSDTFKFFTPRVTLEYDVGDDTMLYATAGRGAKAGGFNPGAISTDLQTFDPEFNWTYEVGSKSLFMDSRLVLNTALYLTKWEDQQVNASDPQGTPFTATIARNLGDATIWGIEVEGSFQATENLSFDGAFSYADATYDSGTVDELYIRGFGPFSAPCDDIICSSDGDIGGNELQNAPDTQISLGAQYESELGNGVGYFVRGDVGYQSSYFASQINAAKFPSRTVVNASFGFEFDRFDVRLWARNLADEKYASNGIFIIQPFSNNILGAYYGERRTVGATVNVNF